ncbi:MAG: lipase family alpha/beta hydrolase [Pyrinomonadaceae bacterium]
MKSPLLRFLAPAIILLSSVSAFAQDGTTGKTPVIVIPGITGSTLFNKKTDEEVWFKLFRPKGDDIRLPIDPILERNHDDLEARDIVRGIKILNFLPEIEIYNRLIYALEERGGYHEAKFDAPGEEGFQDTFYVFPYDWRLDNVDNARLLIRKIESLKDKLKRPNLKFNIVAHSMGGLIARYAAMYGDAVLPYGKVVPTWAGSKHLDKIFLLGTPNEGSILSLRGVTQGYSISSGIPLPLIQNFDRFDVFTIPTVYQLLPLSNSLVVYDENFQKLPIDIFDLSVWDKYDWSIWKDKDFEKEFDKEEQKNARPFLAAALRRAKRFQEALMVPRNGKIPVTFYMIGGDCKDTPIAAMVVYDKKKERWETIIRPKSFTRTDGTKVSEDEVKAKLSGKGDGTVALQSLLMDNIPKEERDKFLPIAGGMFQCEDHTRLVTSSEVQDKLLSLLK